MKNKVLVVTKTLALLVACVWGHSHAQDVAKGKEIFNACIVCHAVDHTNGTGPGLAGIDGRTSGTAAGFRYSKALRNAKITWNRRTLDAYISDPQKLIPGNLMPFSGIPDAQARADLIGYLNTLK